MLLATPWLGSEIVGWKKDRKFYYEPRVCKSLLMGVAMSRVNRTPPLASAA